MNNLGEARLVVGAAASEPSASEAELLSSLRSLQDALWRHPMAVQAAFSALVREGRAFAKTPEGARLRDGLSRSPTLAKTRMVWEVLSLSAFVEKPEGALPGVFADALVRAIKVKAVEPLLSRLFERRRRP
ncbi:MAG TPA: hypothetical protein VHP33_15450 [Polyangiaceae bacterium]|nr:hypothetical protein [Polyangiaceae bacterium]